MADSLPTKCDENGDAIFHTSPRTLLELASIKMAFHIWLEKFDEFYHGRDAEYKCWCIAIVDLEFEVDTLTEVPIAIRKMIQSWFPVIAEELDHLFCALKQDLSHLKYDDIYSRFNLAVFGGNGRVNFKDTIEKFFKDDSLNNLAKFEMACLCCMADKIDSFWPSVCDTLCIDDMRFYNKNYMMYYWICRKRGDLSRIPLDEFGCIEYLMIDKSSNLCYPNWLAIDYFLARLDRGDRLNQIYQLFNEFTCDRLGKFIPDFETSIQRHIVDRNPLDILFGFIEYYKMFDYAIQTWLCIKNFITNEQFYVDVIMKFIRYRNYRSSNYESRGFKIYHYVFYESVLAEIWFHSPRHLKNFIMDFHFLDICFEMSNYGDDFLKNLSRDISFILAMLSDADIELRKKFWDENWSNWIKGVPSAQLNRLMTLCLRDTEAINNFKKHLKESRVFEQYSNKLFARRYLDELNDFLSCVCDDEREKLNIKLKLLTAAKPWKEYICEPYDVEEIQKYYDFIDAMFSNETLAKDFKNQFIMTEDNLNILYNKLDQKNFSTIKIIVEKFISSELRGEIKEILLNRFRELITKGELYKFYESDFENFLMWCAKEDQQPVRNFMKSLSIEDIFDAALLNFAKNEPYTRYGLGWIRQRCTSKDLNKFLTWYFSSTSLSKTFKRERIQVYEGMPEEEIRSMFGMDKESVIEQMKKKLLF